jgi:hypothetical protein
VAVRLPEWNRAAVDAVDAAAAVAKLLAAPPGDSLLFGSGSEGGRAENPPLKRTAAAAVVNAWPFRFEEETVLEDKEEKEELADDGCAVEVPRSETRKDERLGVETFLLGPQLG